MKYDKIHRMVATVLGTGYLPLCPGTWGSLAGLFLIFVVGLYPFLYGILFLAIFFLGRSSAAVVSTKMGEKDPSCIVIDEVAGIFLALFFHPRSLPVIITGFFLFRLFDIIKPPPARHLEGLPQGWGIMLDDITAGLYANLTLRLVRGLGLFS